MKSIALLVGMMLLAGTAVGQETAFDFDGSSAAPDRNPGIKALEDSSQASKFSIAPAGALPDPVLGFGFKNMGELDGRRGSRERG